MKKKMPVAINPMSDIYGRLDSLGFKSKWLQEHILPDWWDDEMAAVPSTRAQIEILLSRQLGVSLAPFRNPSQPLRFEPVLQAAYKHRSNIAQPTLEVAHALASRLATIAAQSISISAALKDAKGRNWTAVNVRAHILKKAKKWIGLEELVEFCWEIGIPIILMSGVPVGHKKLDGFAAWVGERPVIICSCGKSSGAWLAFIIAHELGHLLLRHVPMGEIFVEGKIPSNVEPNSQENPNELLANSFATELLTGDPSFRYAQKTSYSHLHNAEQLAEAAFTEGEKWKIHPGVLALNYGYYQDRRMAMGFKATSQLKVQLEERPVEETFRGFYSRLALDRLPYESASVFERLTGYELPGE